MIMKVISRKKSGTVTTTKSRDTRSGRVKTTRSVKEGNVRRNMTTGKKTKLW